MQISSVSSAYGNRQIDFGNYQNKTRNNKNSSLAPSMSKSTDSANDDAVKSLQSVIKDLKAKKEKIQSQNDIDSDTKKEQLKGLDEQINDIQTQIQELKSSKQKEKIEKQKEQAEKSAEKQKIESDKNNPSKDQDIGGAIVSGTLIDLISANKNLEATYSMNEAKTRLEAEQLDLKPTKNDKTPLRENSYRARKLNKNVISMSGLDKGVAEEVTTSIHKLDNVKKDENEEADIRNKDNDTDSINNQDINDSSVQNIGDKDNANQIADSASSDKDKKDNM